jgi:Cdc6-like AAA superfamily ATPase
MKTGFIQTQNYKTFVESVTALKSTELEEFNSARMALFYGSFGIGKTWAIEKLAASEPKNIIFLRAEEVWTKSYLIKKIGIEFGVENQKIADTSDEIKRHLRLEDRIIVVDEVDKLLNSSKNELLEIFRDLTDQTSCVVIFIGMEQAPIKWAKYGHYHSRLKLIALQKNSYEDIKAFCELSEVKIEEDVVRHFDRRDGNFRIIKRKIEALEEYCELHDIESVNKKVYDTAGVER